jgi:pimeloyl-ACP methyl ester carboxylesterase
MFEIELSAGTIEYEDTGGTGPVVVMLHGLAMDGRLWRETLPELGDNYRCVLPTLPFGAHRRPMRADADLSLRGIGAIVAELLERLQLTNVTLCFNDWGAAQTMIADGLMERVDQLVLASCETADNYPPGLAGHAAWLSAKLPGGLAVMRWTLSNSRLRALPFVYGQMSKRGIPEDLMSEWLEPLKQREIRRDLGKYLGDARRGAKDIRAATSALGRFERPVLVVWDKEGRMMPNEEGRRLAEAFPNAKLVELDDCFTLIPWDQPARLATEIDDFLTTRDHSPVASATGVDR